eukprot:IDg13889t1
MWKDLEESFASTTTHNDASAQTKFTRIQYSDQRIGIYIVEYESLAARLEAMGAPVDECM